MDNRDKRPKPRQPINILSNTVALGPLQPIRQLHPLIFWLSMTILSISGLSSMATGSEPLERLSEYRIQLAAQHLDLSQVGDREPKDLIVDIEDSFIEAPYKTWITGTRFETRYHLQSVEELGNRQFKFIIRAVGTKLRIANVLTDDEVRILVNGVWIDIKIDGHCDNLVGLLDGELTFEALVELSTREGSLELLLLNMESQNSEWNWTMAVDECEGPNGYGDFIQSEVKGRLEERERILELIKERVAANVASQGKQLSEVILEKNRFTWEGADFRLLLDPSFLELTAEGALMINGHLSYGKTLTVKSTLSIENDDRSELQLSPTLRQWQLARFSKASGELQAGLTGISFPRTMFRSVLTALFAKGHLKQDMGGQKISAFKRLMESGFYLNFIWPDLKNFSGPELFHFDFSSLSFGEITLPWVDLPNAAMYIDVNTVVQINLKTYRESQWLSYVTFMADLWLPIYIKMIEKGELEWGFMKPNMDLEHFWNRDYLTAYKPNQKISNGILEDQMRAGTKGIHFNFTAPAITINDDLKLFAYEIQRNKDIISWLYEP